MKRFVSLGEAMIELSESTEPDAWHLGVAGDTLNTAWYARDMLGPDWQVDYVTRVGCDAFSNRIVTFMDDAGINTDHVQRDPGRMPGLYAIDLTDGERSFVYWRGQSAARHFADDENVLAKALREAELIYFSGITLAILSSERRDALLSLIAACGVSVAFDPNYRPILWESPETARQWSMRAAGLAHFVLPSADDEANAFGDTMPQQTVDRYLGSGALEVVVKNGGGPIHHGGPENGIVDDLPRVKPVDTTGAGDSFNAGYLSARLVGATMPEAISAAHELATRVVSGRGALVREPS